MKLKFWWLSLVLLSCRKEETVVFSGNDIPPYAGIPTLLVENYVNRLYIDLIGREPTDAEMSADVQMLESGNLTSTSRGQLVDRLMASEETSGGGESYRNAYYRKLYEDFKARFLDGASEQSLAEEYNMWRSIAVLDSLAGNMITYQLVMMEADKVRNVILSREQLGAGSIGVDEMSRRMMFNSVYDEINMNAFNFINASFEDCFFRFPTEAELELAFNPIDFNGPGALFGQAISNKTEYLAVLTSAAEFDEGMIRWCYRTLLGREAGSAEVMSLLPVFGEDHDLQAVQRTILISDEFAGFD